MDWLYSILDNSTLPAVTALVLGLLTAISPCPLATNLTAVAYISKDMSNRRMVFVRGLLYSIGRIVAYTLLGGLLIFLIRKGEDAFGIQQAVSETGEKILGPILVLVGLFMLFGHLLHLPKFGFSGNTSGSWTRTTLGAFLLGILFAMAFCPTSGMFFFGMLIPMSAIATGGYWLPLLYAISTALPVVLIAWLLAFSMKRVGQAMKRMAVFQKWFNRIVAVLFIGVGVYYCIILLI